jgi:DNA modification methylase
MPDNCVDLVMTSPPYNIKKKYAEYEDFLPWPEFTKWIYCVLKECARISPVSVFVIGTHNKMQFFTEIKQHLEDNYNYKIVMIPTWSLVNPVEMAVLVFRDNSVWQKKHRPPVLCNGTVCTYLPVVTGRAEMLYGDHPCTYPERFPKKFIEAFTDEKQIVFDPFTGTGTTFYVCERFNRNYIGIEISPEYCEIARKRIQEAKDSMGLFKETK